jgi:uncharacterized repeat protein (TIGR03806 family)
VRRVALLRTAVFGLVAILGIPGLILAQSQAGKEKSSAVKPRQVPWNGSKIVGSPEPPAPFRTQPVFPKLKFNEPLAMTAIPGTNRFLMAERRGKIFAFDNSAQVERADLLVDIGKSTYGVVAHPEFQKNGFIFVMYVVEDGDPLPRGSRVSRFSVNQQQGWRCDPQSEQVIFEWPSGGHNAGCLAFGKDGFLYIACGDGSGIADELQTGQDVGDYLASLLRIDVDHPDKERRYSVPKDNPFVNTPGARPEIWAYGLRQVWKFSFDRQTGELWAGEVGQDLWESVQKIEKGGNYGWSVTEGSHPFRPDRKLGPTPILKPILEHPHSDFRSITGGFVYRGSKLKELAGAYVYGDYDTGKIAALRYENGKVTMQQELVDTPFRVITFAEDQAGELYFVDFMNGNVLELVPAPRNETVPPFPRKLSETGLFTSTKELTPAAGVIPYAVNAELWSDHALKERYLAVPGHGQIEFDAVEYPQPAPGAPRGWRFPDGTVAVKTFFMEMEKGNPASKRRLETRILHFEQLAGTEEVGDQVWRGYTYVWNDDQTDAELLDPQGSDRELTIRDAAAPGGMRKQTWHFPSRAECTLCHTMPAKYVLGLNTLQLNKNYDYGQGHVANQLTEWADLGMFKAPLPKTPGDLPKLADYRDEKQPLNERARAYLHANCAHCHMKWGGGNAEFQLLATLPLGELGVVNTRPGQGFFNLREPKVLVPGDPDRSMIYHRVTKLGLGRMPHVASNVVDEKSVKMLRDWITQLPRE